MSEGPRTDMTGNMRAGSPSVVLGLSAGFHDSAACLVVDGEILAAVEQERISRRKHDPSFPFDAAATVLEVAEVSPSDVDVVAINEKPALVLQRFLATKVRSGPRGIPGLIKNFPGLVSDHLSIGSSVSDLFRAFATTPPPISWVEHHSSHAAAAYFPSPYSSAAVVTIDGVGEWATASIAHGQGHRLRLLSEMRFPDSVGLLYSAFTSYCGFRVNSGEGELMGLAPYGDPIYEQPIWDHLVTLFDDGSIRLNQRYFAYIDGQRMTNRRFHDLFGGPPIALGAEPTKREADLASSVQRVTERIVERMSAHALAVTGETQLCVAGGVALNCVANGKTQRALRPEGMWVQPAAGDAGGALGAALFTWHETATGARVTDSDGRDSMSASCLGPSFSTDEVAAFLDDERLAYRRFDSDTDYVDAVAEALADAAVVGWFSGRMEYGPRALGARSILADPRRGDMQRRINLMVKERQAFRPFAPAVLAERVGEWFDDIDESPYMLSTAQISGHRLVQVDAEPEDLEERTNVVRSELPAITHVDGSARVQTVGPNSHQGFRTLIEAFDRLTGCPVVLNTSFNGRAEPIVCTPSDALATARRVGLDVLAIEGCLVDLRDQGVC